MIDAIRENLSYFGLYKKCTNKRRLFKRKEKILVRIKRSIFYFMSRLKQ